MNNDTQYDHRPTRNRRPIEQFPNQACREAGACQDFCGMCGVLDRIINAQSLFGACRAVGYCLDDCGACAKIAKDFMKVGRRRRTGYLYQRKNPSPTPTDTHTMECYNHKTLELICSPTLRMCSMTAAE